MLMGDSVAFSAAYHQSRSLEPPPDPIASIDSRAIIGCDLLAASGWERPQPDGSWAGPVDGACDEQGEAEDVGLAGRPDVVMVMPGAWEYRAARSPEGRVLESRSPEMANELVASLVERAIRVDEVGAEFVVVEWSCPGSETGWERRDPTYVSWINEVLAEAVDIAVRDHDVDAWMLTATDRVCVDANPLGKPTEERITATGDEVHAIDVAGARWFWSDWISPAMGDRISQ
jgi:hypothetical protein